MIRRGPHKRVVFLDGNVVVSGAWKETDVPEGTIGWRHVPTLYEIEQNVKRTIGRLGYEATIASATRHPRPRARGCGDAHAGGGSGAGGGCGAYGTVSSTGGDAGAGTVSSTVGSSPGPCVAIENPQLPCSAAGYARDAAPGATFRRQRTTRPTPGPHRRVVIRPPARSAAAARPSAR